VITRGTQGRSASAHKSARRRAPWIEVAKDTDSLAKHWNRYIPGEPDEKEIDFESQLVVFLLLGPQPTGGYAIEPIDVSISDRVMRVRARLVQPMAPGDSTLQVITAPYAVLEAPANDIDRIEWIDADGRLLATKALE